MNKWQVALDFYGNESRVTLKIGRRDCTSGIVVQKARPSDFEKTGFTQRVVELAFLVERTHVKALGEGELGMLGSKRRHIKGSLNESGETGMDQRIWSFLSQRCERSKFYSKYD